MAHLKDQDVSVDFSEVTTDRDCVAVIATQPLTDNEQWLALPKEQVVLFQDGRYVSA